MSSSLELILLICTRAIFVLLIGLSIWSVSLILKKRRQFKERDDSLFYSEMIGKLQSRETRIDSKDFLGVGVRKSVFEIVLKPHTNSESAAHLFRARLNQLRGELEVDLGTLATLGANAPFIGLLGTVLGIIQAFGTLSTGASAMNSVIAATAEALLATAVGLFVAIPAVLAYNFFNRRIRNIVRECEVLRETYLGSQSS